jgi:hypothetical protein
MASYGAGLLHCHSNVLVVQIRHVFDSGMWPTVMIDVELISAGWMFQFSIENDGKAQRGKKEETEIGITVTSGKETSTFVSASAGFSG